MSKIPQAVVLYMSRALLDAGKREPEGANCEKCMMFLTDTSECSVLVPAKVSGPDGVCGLFVGGEAMASSKSHMPMELVPKAVAGYSDQAPTHCGNCDNFLPPVRCKQVDGAVEAAGCCNAWVRRGAGGKWNVETTA